MRSIPSPSLIFICAGALLLSQCKPHRPSGPSTVWLVQVEPFVDRDGRSHPAISSDVDHAMSVLEERLGSFHERGLFLEATGTDQFKVWLPARKETMEADTLKIRTAISTTGALEFHLVDANNDQDLRHWQAPAGQVHEGLMSLPIFNPGGPGSKASASTTPSQILVEEKSLLEGNAIQSAQLLAEPMKGWCIMVHFTPEGARQLNEVAARSQGRRMAMIVDHVVQSAPLIMNPYFGNSVEISGNFTQTSANDLVTALKSPLQHSMLILEEKGG